MSLFSALIGQFKILTLASDLQNAVRSHFFSIIWGSDALLVIIIDFYFCDHFPLVYMYFLKVASSKYRKLESRKHSKPAAPKQQERAQECLSSGNSGEESSSECEQRPPTPTKSKSNNYIIALNPWCVHKYFFDDPPNYITLHPTVAVGDNMFPLIEREFPFIHVSPSTVRRLRHKQLQQVTALTRSKVRQRTGAVKKMAEMEQKQQALLQIIKKELDHTKRLVSKTKQIY